MEDRGCQLICYFKHALHGDGGKVALHFICSTLARLTAESCQAFLFPFFPLISRNSKKLKSSQAFLYCLLFSSSSPVIACCDNDHSSCHCHPG